MWFNSNGPLSRKCVSFYFSIGGVDRSAFISTAKTLTIIHFNDVYNVEARDKEPVGGAARFKAYVDSLSDKNPLVLFSGDAIAPSNSKRWINLNPAASLVNGVCYFMLFWLQYVVYF